MEDSKKTVSGSLCGVPNGKCSLAMEYVAIQPWEEMYSEEEALSSGTAFPSLNLPFVGRKVQK